MLHPTLRKILVVSLETQQIGIPPTLLVDVIPEQKFVQRTQFNIIIYIHNFHEGHYVHLFSETTILLPYEKNPCNDKLK